MNIKSNASKLITQNIRCIKKCRVFWSRYPTYKFLFIHYFFSDFEYIYNRVSNDIYIYIYGFTHLTGLKCLS